METIKASSFARKFEDRPVLTHAFLDFLSRYYGKEKFAINPELEYYTPLVPVHQSSGSGKSRLMEEISPFVLPVIISGPNPTGLPSGSTLLAEFKNLIVSESKAKKHHVHVMMTVTYNFLVKTLFHSISEKIKSLKATITVDGQVREVIATIWEDGHVTGLDAVADQFFPSSVSADLAVSDHTNPLDGLKAYLDSSVGISNAGIDAVNANNPKNTEFERLGDGIWIQHLKNLLNDIRTARISYFKNVLGNEKRAKEALDWLPHALVVFDEAQGLSGNLEETVKMVLQDIKKSIVSDPFRVFRSSSRNTDFFWKYFWSVAISTNSSVCNFSSSRHDDNSLRVGSNVVTIPPFIYHQSYDIFAKDFLKIFNGVLAMCLEERLQSCIQKFDTSAIMAFSAKPAAKKQFSRFQVVEILSRLVFLLAIHRSEPVIPPLVEDIEDKDVTRTIALEKFKSLLYPRRVLDALLNFARIVEQKNSHIYERARRSLKGILDFFKRNQEEHRKEYFVCKEVDLSLHAE